MKKLRFPLETALKLRERAVEERQMEVRTARAEWDAHRTKLSDLEAELHAATSGLAATHVDTCDLAALDAYRKAAARRRLRLQQESAEIGNRLAERQSAMQRAERDRELLVRLKQQAQSRWQKEYDKEQDALADQAYISRWGAS